MMSSPFSPSSPTTTRLRAEILIVLALSFGISGVRSLLRLVDSLLDPAPLNAQSVTINSSQSDIAWLDIAMQLSSAAVLFAYGALALYLLSASATPGIRGVQVKDWLYGAGLAALIGIPGLALYATALHFGWSKEVIPAAFSNPWVEAPALLVWAGANAFGEEIVVVAWLVTRLHARGPHGLGWSLPAAIAASAVLRGSYHLYQGVSAGFGNIAMGVIFAYFYHRTGRVWPLIIAHFLIDAVAFVGYSLLAGTPLLAWLS